MAVTAERSPFLLTAQGDSLASVFQGRDMLDTTPVPRVKVAEIRIMCGGSGLVQLTNGEFGQLILSGEAANAGDVINTTFGDGVWLDDIYAHDLPADSVVYIYVL